MRSTTICGTTGLLPDEALLRKRLGNEAVEKFLQEHREYTEKRFDKFLAQHGTSVDSKCVHLMNCRAPEVVENFVSDNSVDLVVMGTVARSGLAGMLPGNTAEQILNRIQCSVLAIKPDDFVSTIKLCGQQLMV